MKLYVNMPKLLFRYYEDELKKAKAFFKPGALATVLVSLRKSPYSRAAMARAT